MFLQPWQSDLVCTRETCFSSVTWLLISIDFFRATGVTSVTDVENKMDLTEIDKDIPYKSSSKYPQNGYNLLEYFGIASH